jgi:hypothetical protein
MVKAAGIDPVKVASQLWRQTRLNDPQEHHPPDLAVRPQARSIASRPELLAAPRRARARPKKLAETWRFPVPLAASS